MTTNFKLQNVDLDSIYEAADPAVYKNIPKSGSFWRPVSPLVQISAMPLKQVVGGIAIHLDGTLWQLGWFASSAVQLSSTPEWKQLSGGFAIKTNGTLWASGDNRYGQLGLNDRTDRSSLVQVGTLSNWKQVSADGIVTTAIKTDGTLWTWGGNGSSLLGLGVAYAQQFSSPVQIGSLTNWQSVATVDTMTIAIKTDGTLWSWGTDMYGLRLGQPGKSAVSSPTQIGTATNWKLATVGAHHSAAIKTDGTLWTWGVDNGYTYGGLGLGDIAPRSVPTQVGAQTNWKSVESSFGQITGLTVTAATKTDGTLWVWGSGVSNYGIPKPNVDDMVSSPVQVGSLTKWGTVQKDTSGNPGVLQE